MSTLLFSCEQTGRRGRLFALALLLTLALFCAPVSFAQHSNPASTPPAESKTKRTTKTEWTGLYMSGQKVGYSTATTSPITYGGKPALQETTHSVIHMVLLGTNVQEEDSTNSITDLESRPFTQTINVSSNGSSIHLVANYDYDAHKIRCTLGTGANASVKVLDIPPGANLAGDVDFVTANKKLTVGSTYDVYTIDPSTIVLQKVHVEVVGREEVLDENGKKTPVLVTRESMPVGAARVWIDAKGGALKGEMSFGPLKIVMTAESKQHALDKAFISPAVADAGAPAYAPSEDLAVVTSVKTSRQIDEPRKLQSLHAVIQGIPEKRLILSDVRQREEVVGEDKSPYTVDLKVTSETVDPESSATLPITNPEVAAYLQKAAYLNTEDAGLRQIALSVRGTEKNAAKIALLLRDWVHQNMTPDASIGVPRSAVDILGRRRGVCRDYATLYAALARIAGVPTRLCAGIVYADLNGKPAFYYHAWAESYIGKWVAVDPTLYDRALGIDYVDATHIKFAQGDVTEMYDAVTVVGKIKIELQ